MSEKRFFNCILFEGIVLTILGLCILILPKLTEMSFGVTLSVAFIVYGIYKFIRSIINRNYAGNLFMSIVGGIFIFTLGVLLLLVPKVSLLWIIALIGIFFLLESLCMASFIAQIRNMYKYWGCKFFSATVVFLIGLLIILTLPVMSFAMVAMLSGLGFLIKGMSKIALYNANKNNI